MVRLWCIYMLLSLSGFSNRWKCKYYTDPPRLALTNTWKFVDKQSHIMSDSDSECFDAANQQIWVHLWGPCKMGVYHIMIIIKISKKHILIGQIFHFYCCQIILWQNKMEPFDCAWFGCCPSGRIPSDDYGIPMCNSNDDKCSVIGLTQAVSRWKQMRTHAPKWRECLPYKITWAQISSWDARFIFSLHVGAVVWPLLPDRDTFRWCFDLGFHDQMAASKLTTSQKGRTLIRTCQNTSWNLCT